MYICLYLRITSQCIFVYTCESNLVYIFWANERISYIKNKVKESVQFTHKPIINYAHKYKEKLSVHFPHEAIIKLHT